MDETTWERYGAASGVVFVVLLVASVLMLGTPPHIDATTAKIGSWVAGHRRTILTAQMLGTLSALAFVWWVAHIRHVMQRAEGGVEALSPVVFGAGIFVAAGTFTASLPMTLLAMMARQSDGLSPNMTRMLYDANSIMGTLFLVAAGLFAGTAAMAMVRKEMVVPGLGYAGLFVAGINVIVGCASFYTVANNTALTALQYVAFLSFAAWALGASVAMALRPEVSRVHEPVTVFAH